MHLNAGALGKRDVAELGFAWAGPAEVVAALWVAGHLSGLEVFLEERP